VPFTTRSKAPRWVRELLRKPACILAAAVTVMTIVAVDGSMRATAGPGTFETDGHRILDPWGGEFVPVGANLVGPHAFWPRDTIGASKAAADAWRFNTIRLNTCMPGGCDDVGGWDWPNNNDLDALVDEWTSRHIVVMIALHQVKPGRWPTATQLTAIEAWWRDIATRYGGNPHVWFNLLNEPGSGLPVPDMWRSTHQRLIDAIRGTGAQNMIVVDGTHWGQDAGNWNTEPVPEQNSAILGLGPRLHDPLDRLAFSVHVYDQWGAEGTDAARDARLADYIDRVHAKGLPLLLGETGGYSDRSNAYLNRGTESAYRVAPDRGVGILAWHAQPGDGFALTVPGGFDAIDDWSNPTNLTWHGRLLWDLGHELASEKTVTPESTTTTSVSTTTSTTTSERVTTSPTTASLVVSDSSDRSDPRPLEGETIDGLVYAFALPAAPARSVRFWLDDTGMTGHPIQREKEAPYDFAGGNVSTAKPFDTDSVPDGTHTITTVIAYEDGTSDAFYTTFTVGSATEDVPPGWAYVSASPDRSSPAALSGGTLSGPVYVFVAPPRSDVACVRFWLDDTGMTGGPRQTEKAAPYDFAGGTDTLANPWDAAWVPEGSHSISARIEYADGSYDVVRVMFTTQ